MSISIATIWWCMAWHGQVRKEGECLKQTDYGIRKSPLLYYMYVCNILLVAFYIILYYVT